MQKFTLNQSGGTQRIVIAFESTPAREYALGFFDHLNDESASHPLPDIRWFSFASLNDPNALHDAANSATVADVIVFAIECTGDLTPGVKLWIERWLTKRIRREGIIAGLVADRTPNSGEVACLKEIYLRQTAHRAGMDYLSQELPSANQAIPDSIESYNQRAGQVTSVLDQILHMRHAIPPRV